MHVFSSSPCKVHTDDGRSFKLFIILVGVKGDWVYLRALVCSTYNSVIMHYDIDYVYIYVCIWHHDAMPHCEVKRTPSARASHPWESVITALRKYLVLHVLVLAGCVCFALIIYIACILRIMKDHHCAHVCTCNMDPEGMVECEIGCTMEKK